MAITCVDDRFMDLLATDGFSDDDLSDMEYDMMACRFPFVRWSMDGPILPGHSSRRRSELQQVIDIVNGKEVKNIKPALTISDPTQADCPIVACSAGVWDLSGFCTQEVVGRNHRFMEHHVPASMINQEAKRQTDKFCRVAQNGTLYTDCSGVFPSGVSLCGALPVGELVCVQTNLTKMGELFQNMSYMKQTWLDDAPYIVTLQATIRETNAGAGSPEQVRAECDAVWNQLGGQMTLIEQVLSTRFDLRYSVR